MVQSNQQQVWQKPLDTALKNTNPQSLDLAQHNSERLYGIVPNFFPFWHFDLSILGPPVCAHAVIFACQNNKPMETIHKEHYEAPSTRVFEVRQEGVICASGNDAGLLGAGVDESNADSNGSIW